VIARFTHHGGRIADACRAFGGEPADWLDLSTGINPVPWNGAVTVDWRSLPGPEELAELERAAAGHFGIAAQLCCAVPGSESGLRMIARLLNLPGRYLQPAYRTHAEAFAHGSPIAFGDLVQGAAACVVANPNNPDGVLRPAEEIARWSRQVAAADGWLIVDEAFADCHPGNSLAGAVAHDGRLIVLRSFGKFFGLAGLRLGFVLGPADLIGALRRALGSWPLHAAAIAMGTAAYRDRAWIARTRDDLRRGMMLLDAVLARHGLDPHGACPLFRLVTSADAGAVFERLVRARILVRPFAGHPEWLRLGLPADGDALARLDAALRHG
jgi:cobalamin biosynthetic protein CobC